MVNMDLTKNCFLKVPQGVNLICHGEGLSCVLTSVILLGGSLFLGLGPPGQQVRLPLFLWKQVGSHHKQTCGGACPWQQKGLGKSVGWDPSWALKKHFRKHAILMLCK